MLRPILWRRQTAVIVAVLGAQLALAAVAMGAPASDVAVRVQVQPSTAPDITLPSWFSDYRWADGHGYNVWTSHFPTMSPGYETKLSHAGISGLWIWPVGGGKYSPGSAGFMFRAPGTTRIARADLDVSYRQNLYASHCTSIGLRSMNNTLARDYRCVVPESDQIDIDKDGSIASRTIKLWDPSGAPTSTELFTDILIPDCDKPSPACDKNVPALDPLKNGPFMRIQRVDMTLVDDDLPVVTPSLAFYELDGQYIDGKQTYPLSIAATDAGARLTHTQFDHTDPYGAKAALNESDPTCDPTHNTPALESRICPPSDGIETTVDTRPMPEGTNRFRAWSQDLATNVGDSNWTVIVDRTPPPSPPMATVQTPTEGAAHLTWAEATDPVLADGTPGSGTTSYRVRSRIGDGPWTDWETHANHVRQSLEIGLYPNGTIATFEAIAIDRVGNASEPARATGVIWGIPPVLALAGALEELDEDYSNGSSSLDLSVNSFDEHTGTKWITFERLGVGQLGRSDAICTPGCPNSLDATFGADARTFPQEEHVFHVTASDRAGNIALEPITLTIDRTPPGLASNLHVSEFVNGRTRIGWDAGDDPDITAEVSGAGADTALFQYRRDGGSWSNERVNGDEDVIFTGAYIGELIEMRIKTVDAVGNIGGIYQAAVRVADVEGSDNAVGAGFNAGALHVNALVEKVGPDGGMVSPVATEAVLAIDPSGNTAAALTDANGDTSFAALDPGQYKIAVADPLSGGPLGGVSIVEVPAEATTSASVIISVGGGSRAQAEWCVDPHHTSYCAEFNFDASVAEAYTERIFSSSNPAADGFRGNSFQHSFWVALMMNSVKSAPGLHPDNISYAIEFANLDELVVLNAPDGVSLSDRKHSRVDLHNNAAGFESNFSEGRFRSDTYQCNKLRKKARSARKVAFKRGTSEIRNEPPTARLIFWRGSEDGMRVLPYDHDFGDGKRPCGEPR